MTCKLVYILTPTCSIRISWQGPLSTWLPWKLVVGRTAHVTIKATSSCLTRTLVVLDCFIIHAIYSIPLAIAVAVGVDFHFSHSIMMLLEENTKIWHSLFVPPGGNLMKNLNRILIGLGGGGGGAGGTINYISKFTSEKQTKTLSKSLYIVPCYLHQWTYPFDSHQVEYLF